MSTSVLYPHLPHELPDGWLRSAYTSSTHYQAWFLFNESNEFRDVFLRYIALKDPETALVRACAQAPRPIAASKAEERNALLQRRSVFMGQDERGGGNWDARIRSWIGLSDRAGANAPLQFYKNFLPIKRESLEDLMWRLGLQPYELPRDGWCSRTPYHATERGWRQGSGKLPKKLSPELRERLLKPLREAHPELRNLSEGELASILFLLRSNPPYPMSRKKDLSKLSEEQQARLRRESELQKTRVLTQYFADLESRALENLKRALDED